MINSFIYRFFFLGLQFAASLLLANLLKPAAFGNISLLILNASLFSVVTGLGVESIIIHKLTNRKWELNEAYTFLGIGTLIQLLLFGISQYAAFYLTGRSLLSQSTIDYILPEGVYFLGLVLIEKFISILYPVHLARAANLILLFSAIVFLIYLASNSSGQTIQLKVGVQLFATYTFVQGIALAFFSHLRLKELRFVRPSLHYLLSATRLSVLVMLTNIVQLLAYRLDFWILHHFYGDAAVGVFAQANKMANLLWIYPNIIALLLVPRLHQFSKANFSLVIKVLLWINAFLATGASIVTVFLFYHVIAPEYFPGLQTYFLMLPGYFFWSFVIYYGAYVSWTGAFKTNLIASSLCLIMVLAFDMLLIPKLSLNGAAIANTITYSIVFIYYLRAIRLDLDFKIGSLFIMKRSELRQFKLLVDGKK